MTLTSPIVAAEFDLQQIIFVVIFLVVGFVQWVWKTLQEQKQAAERRKNMPSQEEMEARRKAWEQQTGRSKPQGPATPPAPPIRPVATTPRPVERQEPIHQPNPNLAPERQAPTSPSASPHPWSELMETLRKSVEEQLNPTPAPAPPPLPQQRSAPAPVPAPAVVMSSVLESTPVVASVSSAAPRQRRIHPLADMLRTTHGYKQAFIIKEVLGPPKALQDSPWSFE